MKQVLKRLVLVCLLAMLAVVPVMTAPQNQLTAEAASSKTVTLKKPSGLRLSKYVNRGLVVKWSKVKNATGYEVYVKKASAKKYKRVGVTKSLTYQVKNLKANTKYNIAVRAYRKAKNGEVTYGKFSTLTSRAYTIEIETIHGRYVDTTFKYNTTVKVLSTGKKKLVKAGTRVTAIKRTGSSNTLVMANGTQISAPRSNLSFGNLITTTKYYTTAQKELYVNNKGYSSPTKYLIWVNQYTLNTTIFRGSKGKWKVVRSMPCVVGRYGKTPTGVYRILAKVRGLYGGYGGLYFTGRVGYGNAFHCRVDSNTRAAASNGCVRLGDADLRFMYDNCPVGTTVLSF